LPFYHYVIPLKRDAIDFSAIYYQACCVFLIGIELKVIFFGCFFLGIKKAASFQKRLAELSATSQILLWDSYSFKIRKSL